MSGYPSRTTIRALAWAGLPVFLTFGIVVSRLEIPRALAQLLVDSVSYELPMLFAILAGGYLVLRSTRVEHRFWGLLTIALTALLLSEVYWTWWAVTVSPTGPPLDHPSRVLHLVASLALMGVVVTMTRFGARDRVAEARIYLDVLGMALLVYPVVYLWLVRPVFREAGISDSVAMWTAAVYPVIGGLLGFGCLAVTMAWSSERWRGWERLIALGMGFAGLSLAASPFWYAQMVTAPDPTRVSWYPSLLGAAIYLVFIAAIHRLTSSGEELEDQWPAPRIMDPAIWSTYPMGLVVAVTIFSVTSIVTSDRVEARMLLWVAVLMASVVGGRSWLTGIERVRRLAEGVTDPLTGALESVELDPGLGERIEDATHGGAQIVVAVVGIGGFELIERRHGQEAADTLLADFATVLRLTLPSDAAVYRWLEGTFVVVFYDVGIDDARLHLAEVRSRARRELLDFDRRRVEVHAGASVFPEHGLTASILVERARRAELESEAGEGSGVTLWSPEFATLEPQGMADASRKRSLRRTVRTLAEAVDARDPATRNHSANVAELATALAQMLCLTDDQIQLVGMAALLHDIGKIGIPDDVLLKPAALDDEERAIVRHHVELGERILAPARMDDILPAVRSHHEWWDGTGYPDGLSGHDIPLEARILSVCDTFESMTTGRPYTVACSAAVALREIQACSGTQFDPAVASAFTRMVHAMGVGLEPLDADAAS